MATPLTCRPYGNTVLATGWLLFVGVCWCRSLVGEAAWAANDNTTNTEHATTFSKRDGRTDWSTPVSQQPEELITQRQTCAGSYRCCEWLGVVVVTACCR